jgi:hypothetical protein
MSAPIPMYMSPLSQADRNVPAPCSGKQLEPCPALSGARACHGEARDCVHSSSHSSRAATNLSCNSAGTTTWRIEGSGVGIPTVSAAHATIACTYSMSAPPWMVQTATPPIGSPSCG